MTMLLAGYSFAETLDELALSQEEEEREEKTFDP